MELMTDKARQAEREYKRQWRAANKDKVRAANRRYWNRIGERRATREKEEQYHEQKGDD